jgi:Ca2+-binding RTX toxin-like protein
MSENPDLLKSLLQIPYFASLAEQNGTQWISDLFQELDVRDLNFETLDGDFMEKIGTKLDALTDIAMDNAGMAGADSDAFTVDAAPAPLQMAAVDNQLGLEYASQTMGKSSGSEAQGRVETIAPASAAGNVFFDNLPYDIETVERGSLEWGPYVMSVIRSILSRNEAIASAGADNVVLNGADASLALGGGDDRIYLAARGERTKTFDYVQVDGGAGMDSLYLYRDARHFGADSEISHDGFTVKLDALNDFGANGGQVELNSIENVYGSNHDDNITGNDSANELSGRGGDDVLVGGAGDDILSGGDGNDTLSGGQDDDAVSGGAGDDKIDGGAGDDALSGGDGNDTLIGGQDDDTVSGGAGDDTVDGGAGDDRLSGGVGKDKIDGGSGNDTITGGADDDALNGGGGADTIDGDDGKDTIDGGDGKDTITGGTGNDTINGGAGDDTLKADDGDDIVKGGDGDDVIEGGLGKDTLSGEGGDDTLSGGDGDDIFNGGAGADTITGGGGLDRYVYKLLNDSPAGIGDRDIIMDFSTLHDVFDFQDLTDDPAAQATSLTFVGTAAFSGAKGQIRYVQQDLAGTADDRTLVQLDDDGDGTPDFEIALHGLHTLSGSNFEL